MTNQDMLDRLRQSTIDLAKANADAAFIYGARKHLIIEAVRQGLDLESIAFACKCSIASVRVMATEKDAHGAKLNAKRSGSTRVSRDIPRPASRPQRGSQSRLAGAR